MNSDGLKIAEALRAMLVENGLPEAELRAVPYLAREEAEQRRCVVMVRNVTYEDTGRELMDRIFEIGIAIQQALAFDDISRLDARLKDVQDLADLWGEDGSLRHSALAGAYHEGEPEHPAGEVYNLNLAMEQHLFHSVLSVQYRLE